MPDDQLERHSDLLLYYCKGVLSFHRDRWPPREDALAEQFLSSFPIPPFPTQEDLVQFGLTLGIEVSFRLLPPELAGHNGAYGNKKEITIGEKEIFPGVIAHSFFHELREIIEGVFIDLGFPTESGKQLETRAEHFAQIIRINSATKSLATSFEQIRDIESKWRRWGAILLVLVLAVGYGAGCALLPYFEDKMAQRD